ncbi:MAG: glycosyltransferase family 4 protein [Candidatus Roizmanbacteria bacterium]|nr:glycosyltransferase family 4 protein [Candidatus Roizmanbacteria bacterium]
MTMRVLYLYLFPLWGNGSGAWLRRLTLRMKEMYPDDYEGYILAPETRKLPHIKIRALKPPHYGVFVGNPELPNAKKFSKWSNLEHLEVYQYYLTQTAKAVKKFKPDVIHVFHTAWLPAVARIIQNIYKIPYVITTHGSDLYYLEEDKRWFSSVKESSKIAKYITANSTFTREWYLRIFGKELSDKLRTVPSGIGNQIDFTRDVSWIDKKYNFKYEKMVLFTGRLIRHKGVDYLIKAAQKIKAEIVILGDGPERPYLESLILKYKLTNVHMLGYFSQRLGKIDDFYLRSDVYVAPSVWDEPLGLVILEAMVHKTPVIVTRKGGVTSIVRDGFNGFLVPAKNASVIAKQVNSLIENDAKREKMGENAYSTVIKKFNWEKVTTKFFNIYKKSI